MATVPHADDAVGAYWQADAGALFTRLGSSPGGLSTVAATQVARSAGTNLVIEAPVATLWHLLWRQFSSPLVLILVFAAAVSMIVHDWLDTAIILTIVLITAVTSFVQEYRASAAVEKLRQRVSVAPGMPSSLWIAGTFSAK